MTSADPLGLWSDAPRERSPEEILAELRPLPPSHEMLIEDLTEKEDRLFMAAVLDA